MLHAARQGATATPPPAHPAPQHLHAPFSPPLRQNAAHQARVAFGLPLAAMAILVLHTGLIADAFSIVPLRLNTIVSLEKRYPSWKLCRLRCPAGSAAAAAAVAAAAAASCSCLLQLLPPCYLLHPCCLLPGALVPDSCCLALWVAFGREPPPARRVGASAPKTSSHPPPCPSSTPR